MTEYWKCENGFKKLPEWESDCWIQVTNPTPEELQDLEQRYDAPHDFITDVEDAEERPRIENESGWLMTLIRVPNKVIDDDGDAVFYTVPLAILVHGAVFITICYSQTEMLPDFIDYTNRKSFAQCVRYDLLLSLFQSSSVWYLKYLKHMNIMMKQAEEKLEQKMENDQLQSMMQLEKYLVYFVTSMRGNEVVTVRLKRYLRHFPYDEDLLDDVEIELQQAYATANIYAEVLERQRESYASIISNNLNIIMKRLTSATILLMLPTCVSGFFGMNVPNGWEEWTPAFGLILACSLVLCIVTYFWLKRKRFF